MTEEQSRQEIIVLHDTDGRPYYKALDASDKYNVVYYESSVLDCFYVNCINLKKQMLKNLSEIFSLDAEFRG